MEVGPLVCVGVWLAGCRSGFCSGLAILELVSQCHTGQSVLGGLCSLLGLAHSRHSANICPVNCSAPPNLEGYLKERACRGDPDAGWVGPTVVFELFRGYLVGKWDTRDHLPYGHLEAYSPEGPFQ